MIVGAVVVALVFAFVLGVSDAPNASAALVGTGTARYAPAMLFSFVFHAVGGLIGGTAVAATVAGMIHVSGQDAGAGPIHAAVRRFATGGDKGKCQATSQNSPFHGWFLADGSHDRLRRGMGWVCSTRRGAVRRCRWH